VTGDLAWVKARVESVRGPVASAWRVEGETLALDVEIPVGATATVHVPAADAGRVTEGGRPAAEAEGVTFLREEGGAAVYRVGAGRYAFVSKGFRRE
jgi:alpha-L-rhamnosidase